jgi:AcrR family transcriptional regulator
MAGRVSHEPVVGDLRSSVRRARLLQGAVSVIDELGLEGATVARIAGAACIPRPSFYGVFADRVECLEAVLELLIQSVERELAALGTTRPEGTELVRSGLEAILRTLDRDPPLARVAIVELASGGRELRAARVRAIERVVDVICRDANRHAEARARSRLAVEAAVAGLVWVAEIELSAERPLLPLAAQMAALLLAAADVPLIGRQSVSRELSARPARPVRRVAPMKLPGLRLTARTLVVLQRLAAEPGATNAVLAGACGNVDGGQMSKLLDRLEHHGLVANAGDPERKWAMNVWRLTPLGAAFLGQERDPLGDSVGAHHRSNASRAARSAAARR